MKYRLIRALWKCPLPVGSEAEPGYKAGEFNGICRFCTPLGLEWRIPSWLCASMPHYFREVREGKGKAS